MIQIALLVAALACQAPPPKDPVIDWSAPNSETPAPVVPNGQAARGDLGFVVSPAMPPAPGAAPAPASPQPSVADLFRERNAREAAARAAESPPPPADDGGYHCRRTATSITCGTDEEKMRESEEKAKALLDQMLSPD